MVDGEPVSTGEACGGTRVKLCIIGKFPPIQGGVSMRTYWTAHALAARGHEVHVVTNAREVRAPFRMHMRADDWRHCEATYGTGSVTVHWSDPVDRSQSYIPMASPFVSKLAGIAARLATERRFDVILSHYLEPYGIAGHLAAEIARVPHVVRMAGSDAGRLWRHPQLEPLYDHVVRSAEIVVATGPVAERAIARGVPASRVVAGGGFTVPQDLFRPDGAVLDLATVRAQAMADPDVGDLVWGGFTGGRPHFGVFGKLGESKGSFALLEALSALKRAGQAVGLVALAHGTPTAERRFRARARRFGLEDDILQLPFLPHWRMPEFLRGCAAVCCLEQDFPIVFHTPIVAMETLACGTCLVGATEVIRKLPGYERLPHGHGCVAIPDVNNIAALAEKLGAILRDPARAAAVGARGAAFAREAQRSIPFPDKLERILEAAAARDPAALAAPAEGTAAPIAAPRTRRFPLTRLAVAALGEVPGTPDTRDTPDTPATATQDLDWLRGVLGAVQRGVADGRPALRPLVPAIGVEIAIAEAEREAGDKAPAEDPLFRLQAPHWAMGDGEIATLAPLRNPRLRVLTFDDDVGDFLRAGSAAELPETPAAGPSHVVVFGGAKDAPQRPLLIDALTARVLALSDGTRTAADIVGEIGATAQDNPATVDYNLAWIETLFLHGLISLRPAAADATADAPVQNR